MKNRKHAIRKTIRLLPILLSTLGAMLIIGHGCGQVSDEGSGVGPAFGASQCHKEEKIIEAEFERLTASLVYGRQVLDNMTSCTGIGIPSPTTEAEFSNRSSSFSEFGIATEVSGPMLMGIAAVAGEVCNDLLKLEENLAAQDRYIFDLVDFTENSLMDASDIEGTIRSLTISCWGKQPADEDLLELVAGAQESTALATSSDDKPNRDTALFLCTGILASLNGLIQ